MMHQDSPKAVNAPPTFRDSESRTWSIKLNVGLIESVQVHTQTDLIPSDSDVTAISLLPFNPIKLSHILWLCVERQAAEKGVSRDHFKDAMDGDALTSGWEALADAIAFFTRSRNPRMAEVFLAGINAQMELIEAGAMEAVKAIQSQEMKANIQKAAENLVRDMQAESTRVLDNSATSLPASLASIRSRSVSVS